MKEENKIKICETLNKVGQLLIIGYEGQSFEEQLKDLILEFKPLGLIFFKRNFPENENPAKILKNTFQKCQILALKELKRPLLIAIDQEGGLVQRLKAPYKNLPSATEVADNLSPEEAYQIAKNKSKDLIELGFNFNLSPVLDIKEKENGFIASRSFGQTAEKVIKYAQCYLKAYKEIGLLSSGKHFPTLGSAVLDPHFDLPTINLDKKTLMEKEILPFIELKNQLNSIMTTHAIYPALDKKNPATFSKTIVNIIKNKLNFKGPVISDDLEMGAIVKNFPLGQAAVLSIKAGHDILLICRQKKYIKECQLALTEAIEKNIITPQRLSEAFKRQQTLFNFLNQYTNIN